MALLRRSFWLRLVLRLRLLLTRTQCGHWNESIQATRRTLLLLSRFAVVRGRSWMILLFSLPLIAPILWLGSFVLNCRLNVVVLWFMINSIMWRRRASEVVVLDSSV